MKCFLLFLFLIFSSTIANATLEKYYQNTWCKSHNGKSEITLSDKTRADCLTDAYAIEFEFASKWAESIAQSLNYSIESGKQPGIVIICKKKSESKYIDKIKRINDIYKLNLTIWDMNCF